MSVVKYIGKKIDFKGNTLWEIVGNLKGGGVGRVVVRSMFERYPEKSFMRILKVEPQPFTKPRKVKVLVEKTFRGRTLPKPVEIYSSSYKADYRLLSKEEEAEYCKSEGSIQEKYITPYLEYPPLLKEMVLKEYQKKNEQPPEKLYLTINLNRTQNSYYKLKAPEECTKLLSIGMEDNKFLDNVPQVATN